MTFPIYIDYDTALKESDEFDIKCSLQELQTKADQKVSYRCETNSIKERIKLINLIPNFIILFQIKKKICLMQQILPTMLLTKIILYLIMTEIFPTKM